MSQDLLRSYESDFSQCISQLQGMLDDPTESKMLWNKNPYEYEQAQNYLKQMEIESMNIMDGSGAQGDIVRQRVQRFKAEFDRIRKEIRKRQQAYDKQQLSTISTHDQVSQYLSITLLLLLFRKWENCSINKIISCSGKKCNWKMPSKQDMHVKRWLLILKLILKDKEKECKIEHLKILWIFKWKLALVVNF